MAHGRSYHNLTLLPDGTVLASGGGSRSDGRRHRELGAAGRDLESGHGDVDDGRLAPERAPLPLNGAAAARRPRPDGGRRPAAGARSPSTRRNAEIYSPPYLFKGTRPTITAAPSATAYGVDFDVTTPNAASIAQVSLIRLPSVTHAFDMNQRFQFLNFTAGAGQADGDALRRTRTWRRLATTCSSCVDTNGVPSVASMIRISTAGDVTPPTAPGSLTATSGPGQVALAWTRVDGCRWDRPLQRPPRHDCRLHAERREPNRAADGHDVHRHRTHRRHLLLPRHRRGRRRQRGPSVERGECNASRPGRRRASWPRTGSTRAGARRRPTSPVDGNVGTLSNATWATTGQVRQGALLQRHERDGHDRRLERARPDERDDHRGLGAANRRRTAGKHWS